MKRKNMEDRWWPGTGSNRRHKDFQSFALPTELPGLYKNKFIVNKKAFVHPKITYFIKKQFVYVYRDRL